MAEPEPLSAEPYCPENLRRIFEASISQGLQSDICSVVLQAYGLARSEANQFSTPQAHDLLPHLRRAHIEKGMLDVAPRYGVRAVSEVNEAENSFHVRVYAGQLILTISAVDNRYRMVRKAVFRETLARSSQLTLFDDDEPKSPDNYLYALLIHGPDSERRGPAFIDIVFPNRSYSEYVGRIDLLKRFAAPNLAPEEDIADDSWPILREFKKGL